MKKDTQRKAYIIHTVIDLAFALIFGPTVNTQLLGNMLLLPALRRKQSDNPHRVPVRS
jgi:hypothetical protein